MYNSNHDQRKGSNVYSCNKTTFRSEKKDDKKNLIFLLLARACTGGGRRLIKRAGGRAGKARPHATPPAGIKSNIFIINLCLILCKMIFLFASFSLLFVQEILILILPQSELKWLEAINETSHVKKR